MIKRLLITISLLSLLSQASVAQYTLLGADAYGMGNSVVAVGSFGSLYHNPGGIAEKNVSFVSVNYLRTLPVEGLNTVGIQGVYANKLVSVGVLADSFGDEYYKESRVGLAVAKKLDKVSVGLKMSYLGTTIADMSSRNVLLAEVGMIVTPINFVSFGLHATNIGGVKLYEGIALPTKVSFGAAIRPDPKLTISSQADFVSGEKLKYRFGLHYQIRESLGLSSGVDPDLRAVHFGVNLFIKQYGLYYAVASHPNVGMAHHLSLIFKFNE